MRDFFRQNTRGITKIMSFNDIFSASKPSGCTLKSKGRQFNLGQHEEFLNDLLSICPLHPGDCSRQNTRKNTKIMPFNDFFFQPQSKVDVQSE